MSSKHKQSSVMTVGQQLKSVREEQKQLLREIADKTKVQPWVLEALEDDRLHEMMSPIYVKGFLTTYAKHLHLDAHALIAQIPIPKAKSQLQTKLPKSRRLRINFRIPSMSIPQVRRLTLSISVAALFAAVVLLNPLRWISDITVPQGIITKLASMSPVSQKSHPLEMSKLDLAPGELLELTIIADRATWVRVKADGKLLTQQQLPRGSKERWTAKREFDIVIAKPTQVRIILNGQSIHPHAITYRGKLHISRSGITRLIDESS